MKILSKLTFVFSMSLFALPAFAEGERTSSLDVDAASLLFGEAKVEFSHKISTSSTLGISGGYYANGIASASALGLGWNYWFAGNPYVDSWVAGPSILAINVRGKFFGIDLSGTTVGLGLSAGYVWAFESGFQMGLKGTAYFFEEGVAPDLDFNVGFSF